MIEVVVALVVTVLIWGATASALATVARMDAAAERLYEAALLARRLSERDERTDEPEADPTPEGWRFERLTEKDADGRAWRGWRIQSPDSSIFDERIFTRPIRPSVPEAENKASDFSKCIRFAVHSCMKRMNTGIG